MSASALGLDFSRADRRDPRALNPVHEHVQKLLDLQKVDQEVSSLTKDIDQLPAEEEKRKRRLDQLERAATEAAVALQKAEVESRNCDSASRAADEQVTKLSERLNVCRNNAEYQATLFEIVRGL